MSSNIEMENSFNNIFGVKHYNVKVIKKKENFLKYTVSSMFSSYKEIENKHEHTFLGEYVYGEQEI